MARLGMAGFETGDVQATGSVFSISTAGTTSVVSATPSPRTGSYCLKCVPSYTTSTKGQGLKWAHSTVTEMWYAFGLYKSNVGESTTAPNHVCFANFDSAGNANLLVTAESDGNIRAYYASAGAAAPTSAQVTLIATGTASITDSAWHLLEVHFVAATGATGTVEVYLDGTQIINATSQRTCQTNANTASFGVMDYRLQSQATSTHYMAFDDVRWQDTSGSVNNGRPGGGSIVPLTVTGAGTAVASGLASSSGTGVANDVDDIPPNTTDYGTAAASGDGQTFQLSDPTGVASCQAVNVIAYMENPAGGSNVYLRTKTGAGASDGSSQAITASWTYYGRLLETDPADSGAWTQTKLAALEAGMKAV